MIDVAEYAERGYHIERGLFSSWECLTLRGEAGFLNNDRSPLLQPHRMHAAFMAWLRAPKQAAIAERILGAEASGLGTEYFYHQPGTKGFTPHQDNMWVRAPRARSSTRGRRLLTSTKRTAACSSGLAPISWACCRSRTLARTRGRARIRRLATLDA